MNISLPPSAIIELHISVAGMLEDSESLDKLDVIELEELAHLCNDRINNRFEDITPTGICVPFTPLSATLAVTACLLRADRAAASITDVMYGRTSGEGVDAFLEWDDIQAASSSVSDLYRIIHTISRSMRNGHTNPYLNS
jgi:hypothetical protein